MFESLGSCVSCKVVRKNISILVAGIDNAGKTTVVHGIIGEAFDTVAPTLGFSSEVFSSGKFTVTFLDLGGGERIRDIWKNYLAEIHGVVYVVDSTDKPRLPENKLVFENLVSNTLIQQKPILLLANKQDSSDAVDEVEICEKLNLEDVVNKYKCPCRVERCAAITSRPGRRNVDKSIKSGFKWLLGVVEQRFDELKDRVTQDVEKREEKLREERKLRMERVRKRREERERREQLEASLAAEEDGTKVATTTVDDSSTANNHSSVAVRDFSDPFHGDNDDGQEKPRPPGYIAGVITSSVVNNVQKSFLTQPNHDGGITSQTQSSALGDQLLDDDSTSVGIVDSNHVRHHRHEDSCTESQQGEESEQQPSLNVPTLQEDSTETLHQNMTITNLSLSDSASHTTVNSVPDIATAAKDKTKAGKKEKKKKRRKTLRKNQVDPMMFAEAPPLVGNGMPPLAKSDIPPSIATGKRLNPLPAYCNPSFEREKSDLSSNGTNSTLDLKPLPSLKKPNTEDDESILT